MATRTNRFITGMVSGYGNIAVNVVTTMISLPMALHYLDKERFGLWALALQINAYLALIDLGMNNAVSRFLAEYKDDVNGKDYAQTFFTGAAIYLIQGLLVAAAGFLIAPFAAGLFSVPEHLKDELRTVLVYLTSFSGLSVALRAFGAPLWAFQRNDVIHACATASHIGNLILLWIGLKNGWGVMSMLIALIPPAIGTLACHGWVCHRNGYFPSMANFCRPTVQVFLRIFHFGKDNLLVVLGGQLVNASQIMIISCWIGLEAAAIFTVATKFYSFAILLVANPVSASSPALAELWVRREKERFVVRFWDLVSMILFISTIAAIGLAVGNRAMIHVWTQNQVVWTLSGDLLLAILIILRSLNSCFIGLFGLVGSWTPVRWIQILEGVAFISLAMLMRGHSGLNGILAASIFAYLTVTGILSYKASKPIIGSFSQLWLPLSFSMLFTLLASCAAYLLSRFNQNPYLFLGFAVVCGILATPVMWKLALPPRLRQQAASKLQELLSRYRPANG